VGENQTAVEPTALNGEKGALLADIANKIQALDNSVKLNILSLLVEAGSLSITDIAKKLDINFSTAHKYLEQLEGADLVASKQVADNRLKRMFTIQDFNIELSPKALFKKSTESNNHKEKSKFRILDNMGQLVDFDEEIFSQKYIKRGMPRGTILLALQEALEQAYDGITLLELRRLFRANLEKKSENIHTVLSQMDEDRRHKKTFSYILSMEHPEALKQHTDGDIFIRNLRGPIMLKFSHDIRSIYMHGGAEGKPQAKNLGELLSQIDGVIDAVYNYARVSHILDSFNYFIAPAVGKTLTATDITKLREFLTKLNSKGIRFYLGLELGMPAWAKSLSPHYYFTEEEKPSKYSDYADVAQSILSECLKFLAEAKLERVYPVLKVHDKTFDKSVIQNIPTCLVANMRPSWQSGAASYSIGARFGTRWKGWESTVRVGEVQNITVNLPRLAYKANKNESKFFQDLGKLLGQVLDYTSCMASFVTGEFLKYRASFKSSKKERWDCAHIDNSTYYISLTGLDEAVYLLSGKRIHEDSKLAEKILKECQKAISAYSNMPLRIELKEEPDDNVAYRFYHLDKKEGVKTNAYTKGASCKDYLASAKLHQYMLGGHCAFVPKKDFDFEAFAKAKGGLARLT
jgi:DNA-binding MarR family transcriptional regulator